MQEEVGGRDDPHGEGQSVQNQGRGLLEKEDENRKKRMKGEGAEGENGEAEMPDGSGGSAGSGLSRGSRKRELEEGAGGERTAKKPHDGGEGKDDMEVSGNKEGGGSEVRPTPVMVCGLEVNEEEEPEGVDFEEFFDERTGQTLDAGKVRAARSEEMEFMSKIQMFEEVDEEECWRNTGKAPVSTKWVDVDKGTSEAADVRCRLVARDFKPKGDKDRPDLFAAMPPLEAKKLLFLVDGIPKSGTQVEYGFCIYRKYKNIFRKLMH